MKRSAILLLLLASCRPAPEPSPQIHLNDYKGAIHVHSKYSHDSKGTYEEILSSEPDYRDCKARVEAMGKGKPIPPTSVFVDSKKDDSSLVHTKRYRVHDVMRPRTGAFEIPVKLQKRPRKA